MDAFGNSCNCAFSNIGLSLDLDAYHKLCQKMLFNQDLPTALKNTAVSKMTLEDGASSSLIMQTAIGQGRYHGFAAAYGNGRQCDRK